MRLDTQEVMLDLETLGTKPGAVIVSIGACFFDSFAIDEENTFYVVVDKSSCIEAGLHVDPDTVKWWKTQSEEARSVFEDPYRLTLKVALQGLSEWMTKAATPTPVDPIIWGDGANFDPVLLEAAYAAVGLTHPWKYWNVRCFRTAKAEKAGVPPVSRRKTHHHALDDAIYQAEHLIRIRNWKIGR